MRSLRRENEKAPPQNPHPCHGETALVWPDGFHFLERFLWMDEIIGVRAGGLPWLLVLRA